MNSNSFKACNRWAAAVLLISALTWSGIPAAVQAQSCGEDVKIEKIKATEWKIIDRQGQIEGTLKSESLQSFKFYNTDGMFIGTILENGSWQPMDNRSRNTLITAEEARLYLDALDAIALVKAGNTQSGSY